MNSQYMPDFTPTLTEYSIINSLYLNHSSTILVSEHCIGHDQVNEKVSTTTELAGKRSDYLYFG